MSNTTPPKSLRSRMGTAMRRTSSILALSRPSTPGAPSQGTVGRARSSSVATSNSDTSSASRPSVDTSAPTIPPISPPSAIMMPSPIAESPAREAAATADEIREELREPKTGPTPLAQVVTASIDSGTPAETVETPSNSESTGLPILGSANEPHILTEEPDEMSLRAHTIESSRESAPNETQIQDAPAPVASASASASASEVSPAPVLEAAPSYFEIPAHPPSESLSDSESLHKAILENTMGVVEQEPTPDGMLSDQTTPRPHGPSDTENANVFYQFSDVPAPATNQIEVDEKSTFSISKPTAPPTANTVSEPPAQTDVEVVQMPLPEIADEGSAQPSIVPSASYPIPIPPKRQPEDANAEQVLTSTITNDILGQPAAFVPKDKNVENSISIVPYDVGSTEQIWASDSEPQKNGDAVGRQRADNSAQTLQDPFADPVPSIHPSTIGTMGLSGMPEPDITTTQSQNSVSAPQTMPEVVVIPVTQREDVSTRYLFVTIRVLSFTDSIGRLMIILAIPKLTKLNLFLVQEQRLSTLTFILTHLSRRLPISMFPGCQVAVLHRRYHGHPPKPRLHIHLCHAYITSAGSNTLFQTLRSIILIQLFVSRLMLTFEV
ncbi:hypothetical protein GGU11DRAFT_317682 [Lentinula aff. detonsa]|nr:hypothetical protein GGU11DRAFT_317682 [Lentinula aff. detonsa]